ncbi:MAG: hypothetical protein JNM88_03630 [Chitinophagaceae bacterium]|nr:hypothetical protein [Chitinophagaceae bacterium]
MTKIILVLLVVCLANGCNKQPVGPIPPLPPSIIGEWEWYLRTGFFAYDTPLNTGKTYHLTFNSDSTFVATGTLDSRLMGNGTFSVRLDTTGSGVHRLSYILNGRPNGCGYRIRNNDTLTLDYNSYIDGQVFYFSRVP